MLFNIDTTVYISFIELRLAIEKYDVLKNQSDWSEGLLGGPPLLGWLVIILLSQGEHIIILQYNVLNLIKFNQFELIEFNQLLNTKLFCILNLVI